MTDPPIPPPNFEEFQVPGPEVDALQRELEALIGKDARGNFSVMALRLARRVSEEKEAAAALTRRVGEVETRETTTDARIAVTETDVIDLSARTTGIEGREVPDTQAQLDALEARIATLERIP